jgi:hypothetical protein
MGENYFLTGFRVLQKPKDKRPFFPQIHLRKRLRRDKLDADERGQFYGIRITEKGKNGKRKKQANVVDWV